MKIVTGQRWQFRSYDDNFIIEIISPEIPTGRVVHVIANCIFKLNTVIDSTIKVHPRFWTYLEGQDRS